MTSLRELNADQLAIQELINNNELTQEEVQDHLDSLAEDKEKKIESCLFVLSDMESKITAIKNEMFRLKLMGDVATRASERLKEYVGMNMSDGDKYAYELFTVSKVKGREIVQIDNADAIEGKWLTEKVTASPDKMSMLKALKAGQSINGASITRSKSSLRIK